ncbi:mediator complex subunit Med9 [Schizosaccharomyces cryophilus OY26]|uniref:Mediator complex subunit Med9 n=1 Tax=Schizosaccharomyces cryophilus (strain OY26 / ATCC MYA-4695 / CBS 11777 / NBRC 106824 / NRRL Y48691) TaxID=653667 RepID=S9VWJ0_SCHCR|nr:mediator complex subunit Med9 [Schizosaccharomyces cryophilus OY26]EPY50619.1 mediator complex subunit Med9 [Schizosaccharomyces cryophilus OY26]
MGDARDLLQKIKQERTGVKRTRSDSIQEKKKAKPSSNDSYEEISQLRIPREHISQKRLESSNDETIEKQSKSSLPDDFFDESIPRNENLINKEWVAFQDEINSIAQEATQKESLLQDEELKKHDEEAYLKDKETSNGHALFNEEDTNLRPDDYDALYLEDSNQDYKQKLSSIKESFQRKRNEPVESETNVSDEELEGSVIDDSSLWGIQENT